jgi:hypothetical protein
LSAEFRNIRGQANLRKQCSYLGAHPVGRIFIFVYCEKPLSATTRGSFGPTTFYESDLLSFGHIVLFFIAGIRQRGPTPVEFLDMEMLSKEHETGDVLGRRVRAPP